MRGFFIITRTIEMHKHVESFTSLGHEVDTYVYNHRGGHIFPKGMDEQIYEQALAYRPDIIVYVGACNSNVPTPEGFKRLKNEIAPTVCFVSDAGDEPWWRLIYRYDVEQCFTVQVALDGPAEWPKHDTHITALTPIDPKYYPTPPKPHSERKIAFGFPGNITPPRKAWLRELSTQLGLHVRERPTPIGSIHEDAKTYVDMAKFMSDTRIVPNFAFTGSGKRLHVKGRVLEAGWAGSFLMEFSNSPAKNFFTPGEDYMEFNSMKSAKQILDHFKDKPDETEAFGLRLRKKVEENYSAKKFWERILERTHG